MPTITSLAPAEGPSTGGTSVVITGTDFGGPTTVQFGSTATTFTLDSDTQITAIAPGGAVGTVQVTVSDASGVSNGEDYEYLAVPALTSVTPGQGSEGDQVVLAGTGLTGVTDVAFGAVSTTFVVDSDTQITADVPAGTGIVTITAIGPGGTSNPVSFVYVVVPNVTAVVPTSGPEAGGTAVTVTGDGFVGPLTVRFGTTATSFTIDSDTQITAIAPPGTGAVQVTVTGSGGAGTGATYTYV